MEPSTRLTDRFTNAVAYATAAHGNQTRKGTAITYLSHLLGVAALVLEHGGSEDQAIAGLLHDCIEDQGSHHEAAIRATFGETVARIVRDCTDGTDEEKRTLDTVEARRADWKRRKLAYIAHIEHADADSLLVSCCDKLHNARAIVADLRGATGRAVFDRFKAGRDGTFWYYGALAEVFKRRKAPASSELAATVAAMHAA